MSFTYYRTVRFQDTDAAGVVYFANELAICHEAYETSLVEAGINLRSFFSSTEAAIPIAHASVDFFRPLFCGDLLIIHLTPKLLSDSEFEITYEICLADRLDKAASKAYTRHVCIEPKARSRRNLPVEIGRWLQQWQN
ncbi:MAG: thioesterase family protein [Kovacikia sp.]